MAHNNKQVEASSTPNYLMSRLENTRYATKKLCTVHCTMYINKK